MPQATGGVDAASLGTIKRSDGDTQVTYHGHPLYYYAADAATPGRTKGEDVKQFGAGWYLVGAAGKPMEPESGSHSTEPSPRTRRGGTVLRVLGALTVLVVGVVHLEQYFAVHFNVVPVIGPLFALISPAPP